MFDLEFFEARKQELENLFNNGANEIKKAEAFIKEKQVALTELRGSFSECEANIAKLKGSLEKEDVKVDGESEKEDSKL